MLNIFIIFFFTYLVDAPSSFVLPIRKYIPSAGVSVARVQFSVRGTVDIHSLQFITIQCIDFGVPTISVTQKNIETAN